MDTARFLEDDIYDEFSIQQGSKLTSICLDNLLNFGFKKQGAAGQYMKSGQSACTFCISQGFQWCQRRNIIVTRKPRAIALSSAGRIECDRSGAAQSLHCERSSAPAQTRQ